MFLALWSVCSQLGFIKLQLDFTAVQAGATGNKEQILPPTPPPPPPPSICFLSYTETSAISRPCTVCKKQDFHGDTEVFHNEKNASLNLLSDLLTMWDATKLSLI